jgi:hypothetical protein
MSKWSDEMLERLVRAGMDEFTERRTSLFV